MVNYLYVHICPLSVLNHRRRSPYPDCPKTASIVSFPLKKAFPSLRSEATILKTLPCAPLVFNSQLRSPVRDHLNTTTTLSFPLKTTYTCLKSKALLIPSANIGTQKMSSSHSLRISPLPRRGPHPLRAMKDILSSFSSQPYPETTEKPEWWWRTLACLPYLMNFYDHRNWAYAYPTKNPSPFLKILDSYTFPLILAISQLPNVLLSAHWLLCYFGVVRQQRWPHFLRFHVMTAILMGAAVQVIGITSGWCPSWFFPPHFWSAASIGFLLTMMHCLGCALGGSYPNVPVITDAANLHSNLRLR